jgi:hypothetical protein
MSLVLPSEMTDNTNKAMSSAKTIQQFNNSSFGDFVDRIYPVELEIKDTPDTDRWGRRGHDCMVVEFITTYVISVYHH